MTWARSGVAVLIPDQPGAGERVESQAFPREGYYSRYATGIQLYIAGESLMKWMVWDMMRGIDMLLERPYIDPKRIVMLGAVAGGGDPAAVTAALDSESPSRSRSISAKRARKNITPEALDPTIRKRLIRAGDRGNPRRNLRRSAADRVLSMADLRVGRAASISLLVRGRMAKSVEEEPIWARYNKVFQLYGKRGNIAAVNGFGPFPGPGECTNVGSYSAQANLSCAQAMAGHTGPCGRVSRRQTGLRTNVHNAGNRGGAQTSNDGSAGGITRANRLDRARVTSSSMQAALKENSVTSSRIASPRRVCSRSGAASRSRRRRLLSTSKPVLRCRSFC